MHRLSIVIACALVLASCSKEDDLYEGPQQKTSGITASQNAKEVFGVEFPADQDWSMMKNGQVTIVANAPESEYFKVAKVQVLTGNPFVDAKSTFALNSATAKYGDEVKLFFDAPKTLDTLYAACVSDKGQYRVLPFAIGKTSVAWPEDAAGSRAARAAVAQPRVISEGRNSDNVNQMLKPNKAKDETQWENSGWSDKFYDIEATVEDVADFTNDERDELYKTLTGIMPENTDNMTKVEQSQYFINTSNYFYADGTQKPITVTPVRCGADLLGWEQLFYYYYDPAQVEGMSDTQRALFLKSLPKFKLLDCADALVGLDKGATPEERVAYAKNHYTSWRNTTRRSRTYTLAYFGDGEPAMGATGSYQFPAGYRIGLMFRVDSVPERPGLVAQDGKVKSGVNFYADSLLNNEPNLYAKWYYGWNSATRKTQVNYLGVNKSRAAVYSANGKAYIGFEDLVDKDFNDVVFEVAGGVTLYEDSIQVDDNVYTMAFEDTNVGDFDLNDVVIKAKRTDRTHVKFSLEATGAWDEIYLGNMNGKVLNGNTEVHAIFGQQGSRDFVNTVESAPHVAPVQEEIQVPENFTFTDDQFLPCIENRTKGNTVHIAHVGEDPHGIIIPWDFQYPTERTCVKNAYTRFNDWGLKNLKIEESDWYKYPTPGLVYTKSVFE
jgi:hypothetical protein